LHGGGERRLRPEDHCRRSRRSFDGSFRSAASREIASFNRSRRRVRTPPRAASSDQDGRRRRPGDRSRAGPPATGTPRGVCLGALEQHHRQIVRPEHVAERSCRGSRTWRRRPRSSAGGAAAARRRRPRGRGRPRTQPPEMSRGVRGPSWSADTSSRT
jgi:hypothetical protein